MCGRHSVSRRRGVSLPRGAAGEAIRWHPACPFQGERVGAMVALIRDLVTDEPVGIHRTALDAVGNKLAHLGGKGRLVLGSKAHGAVKLTPDADVTHCLGIGEGIETTLSLRRLPEFGASPVWALLDAGNMSALPVLTGIETLFIATDHDPAGVRAANVVAARWAEAEREAYLITPTKAGADLNDIREARHVA